MKEKFYSTIYMSVASVNTLLINEKQKHVCKEIQKQYIFQLKVERRSYLLTIDFV